jgi:hypothetical protein
MAIAPSSAVTLTGAEQAVRAGIAAAQKSGTDAWKILDGNSVAALRNTTIFTGYSRILFGGPLQRLQTLKHHT